MAERTGPDVVSEIRSARGGSVGATELQALLALRVAVFVVEQECAYQEVDGRDLEPGTWHAWVPGPDGTVLSCLGVLTDPGGRRIGRVCTAKAARGAGHAARLMAAALEEIGAAPSVLDAQTYAQAFYARFGYTPAGDEFVEDGIPHVTMRRA
ncbi:MAG: GNAT family N-acetyltransferase [Pseudonocardia sp.]|nr:GNAT family N-acetyltransferase [Pseudonocardia sp.]